MSGTSDPTAFADRLAEIREFRAQLSGRFVLADSYAKDLDSLLAAYDTLVTRLARMQEELDVFGALIAEFAPDTTAEESAYEALRQVILSGRAAYDARAEELAETRTLVGRQTAKLASAIADKVRAESRVAALTEAILAFEKSAMLALARAGQGGTTA